jgi:G3E family GTPase
VLVNEFGSIDIDSALVETTSTVETGTIELSNGCVCCTINESLLETLTQMMERRSRLDCLVLETSGVADPQPIIDTLRTPRLANAIRLDAVVTVVDAGRLVEQMMSPRPPPPPGKERAPGLPASGLAASAPSTASGPARKAPSLEDSAWGRRSHGSTRAIGAGTGGAEAQSGTAASASALLLPVTIHAQLELADVIVINKTDLVSAAHLATAEASLRLLLSIRGLQLIRARNGAVSHELLLGHLPQLSKGGKAGPADPAGLASRARVEAAGERPSRSLLTQAVSTHLARDSFRSVAYSGERPLSLQAFEAMRTGDAWAHVVRAKGFLRFAECEGYWLTMQMCGSRIEARATTHRPSARRLRLIEADANASTDGRQSDVAGAGDAGGSSQMVVIGVGGMDPPRVLELLRAAEVEGPAGGGVEPACGVCEDAEAAEMAAASAGFLAKRMRRDPRIHVLWVRGGVVAFRMLGWFDTTAETLNTELLNDTNSSTSGSARTWIAPTRGERCGDEQPGQLTLLHASGPHTRPAVCWADLQAAAERVMTRHLSGFVCGSCDCLENLAGQVLV